MKLYCIIDDTCNYTSAWTSDYTIIKNQLDGYRLNYNDYNDKDRIFVESITVPDSIEPELEEVY